MRSKAKNRLETGDSSGLKFKDIFEALGGEPRNWHPAHSGLERPESTENRPKLDHCTGEIGDLGEEYLAERYDMELIDDGPVDLRVTDGPFEGIPVQAKNAVRLANRGDYCSDGGIYVKGPAMADLVGGTYNQETKDYEINGEPEEALLHAIVHHPREEFTDQEKEALETPVKNIVKNGEKVAETALVGEIVIPAGRAVAEKSFDAGSRKACYWHWSRAYQPFKDPDNDLRAPCEWYEDSFISRKLK